jgi:hypothetical protein
MTNEFYLHSSFDIRHSVIPVRRLGSGGKQERECNANGCAKVAHHLDTGDQQLVR